MMRLGVCSLQSVVFAYHDSKTSVTSSATLISLTIQPFAVEVGKQVTLTAKLTETNGTPIENAEITFILNNLRATATTGKDGTAVLAFAPQTIGNYEVEAQYAGSTDYAASSYRGILSVQARSELLYLPAIIVTLIAMIAITVVTLNKRKIPQ